MSDDFIDPETGYIVKQTDPEFERLLDEEKALERELLAEEKQREETITLLLAMAPFATKACEVGDIDALYAIGNVIRFARSCE